MVTEYELSARLVFWGDVLNSKRLADDLQLEVSLSRSKGEPLKRPDGTESGGIAKTGILICELSAPESSLRRDPESQLRAACSALKQLIGPLEHTYGASDAQLQVFIYYEKKVCGEPDFDFSVELVELLARYGIKLTFTVLP